MLITTNKLDYGRREKRPLPVRAWDWVWFMAWWTLIGVMLALVLLPVVLAVYGRYVDPSFFD